MTKGLTDTTYPDAEQEDDSDNAGSYESIMETFGGEEGFYDEFGLEP